MRQEFLNGAEVIAETLSKRGIKHVFAYPGTSELQMCDAVVRSSDSTLINARGDKEAVFMAAGGSLIDAGRCAAIVHGARGLTNAAGAVADAFRNEVGTLILVGLPSTASSRFLPPHGENNLLEGIGQFVKHWYPPVDFPADETAAKATASAFLMQLEEAITLLRRPPFGPVMVGVPQDIAEKKWFPADMFDQPASTESGDTLDASCLNAVAQRIRDLRSPVILIDDYYLKYESALKTLDTFSKQIGAPVLQVRYRRGPMLFQRVSPQVVEQFAGWYDPAKSEHRELLERADGIILLEDRNMYARVIGRLPDTFKISITSSPVKARKNEILGKDDLLVAGDVATILRDLTARLSGNQFSLPSRLLSRKVEVEEPPVGLPPSVRSIRSGIAAAIGESMGRVRRPVVVDDSQMFGGMLSQGYDSFPHSLRVFGSHGGFVGSGLSYATGLAISDADATVLCTLGDQAFTNAIQGLVCAVEQSAKVCFIVCNNGRSVSLHGQSKAGGLEGVAGSGFLNNSSLDYVKLATALGIRATTIAFDPVADKAETATGLRSLKESLDTFIDNGGPALIELKLPSDLEFWSGIWLVKGYDEK